MNERWLAVMVGLQVMILANQWISPSLSIAEAQVPDAGAQRIRMIEELRAVNEKLDKLNRTLESGKLQVTVVSPDDEKSR